MDEPVGRVDPEGLEGEAAVAGVSWLDSMVNATKEMFNSAKNWFTGAPSPSPADVTQGVAQGAADAAQAVTKGYDTMRTAGAQVSRTVPEVINSLPVSPKEVGTALKAGEVAQQVGAMANLDDTYQRAIANATDFKTAFSKGAAEDSYEMIDKAARDQQGYFNTIVKDALHEGAKIAPTPIGSRSLKR